MAKNLLPGQAVAEHVEAPRCRSSDPGPGWGKQKRVKNRRSKKTAGVRHGSKPAAEVDCLISERERRARQRGDGVPRRSKSHRKFGVKLEYEDVAAAGGPPSRLGVGFFAGRFLS